MKQFRNYGLIAMTIAGITITSCKKEEVAPPAEASLRIFVTSRDHERNDARNERLNFLFLTQVLYSPFMELKDPANLRIGGKYGKSAPQAVQMFLSLTLVIYTAQISWRLSVILKE